MTNREIAACLFRFADLIEIEGADPFRARAYRRAGRAIEGRSEPVADMVAAGRSPEEIAGVGAAIAAKVRELLSTGRICKLAELEARVPAGLLALAAVPGLGPRRVHALRAELGVTSADDLARALADGRVRAVRGFGKRAERRMTEALARRGDAAAGLPLTDARRVLLPIVARMRRAAGVLEAHACGDVRRNVDMPVHLALVLVCAPAHTAAVMAAVAADESVAAVEQQTERAAGLRLRMGAALDVYVTAPEFLGTALIMLTGSRAHAAALAARARDLGYVLRADGLWDGSRLRAGDDEREVYRALGMAEVPPEMREARGEVEAALENRLPRLVGVEDLRGDLHCHTVASDGRNTIEEMARAARERGYEYLAITDHTKSTAIAHGLDDDRMRSHIDAIERANEAVDGIRLLKSAEVDILPDGSLDLSDDVLARLDLRVCSVHSHFRFSREEQTARVLRAMEHPAFDVLGHPTGRLLGTREPYPIDVERVLEAARAHGRAVEVNSQPTRLDLCDEYCRMAKEAGVKVVVSTDAHGVDGLSYADLGVGQARRGWLEPVDVLNTRPWDELRAELDRR